MIRGYAIVDVFTEAPLEGNALGVFPAAGELDPALMQRAARELNLSETVFVLSRAPGEAEVRIFTPTAELPFAGHPVLGTAVLLGELDDSPTITLRTGAGPVRVELTRPRAGGPTFGEMEQPLPEIVPFEGTEALLRALGTPSPVLPVEAYRNGPTHVFVALEDPEQVVALRPDMGALNMLGPIGVSCFAHGGGVVKTRMFAPGLGVPEDPATGSAAGPLAVHLVRHKRIEAGTRLRVRQGEEIARPSMLYACAEGTPDAIRRVTVGGAAVVVARGEYRLV